MTLSILRRPLSFVAVAVALAFGTTAMAQVQLETIRLPEGFSIEVYCDNIPNARAMSLGDDGVLYVGSRKEGNVYAVVDSDGDQKADDVHVLMTGLKMPSGVEWIAGDLYVADVSRILKLPNIGAKLDSPPEPEIVTQSLPRDGHHGWKYLRQGPDGMLYFNIGAPCNVCDEGDPYASIARMNLNGTGFEIFARGVRNSVGFAWHPETKVMYFTDNGRDMLGDNRPPCELNRAPEAGMHFGYPYIHGNNIIDPELGGGKSPAEYTPPAQELGPHVAPLGLAFNTGDMFPDEYKNQLFIAEHGSWNRTKKIGYRVMMVTLDENGNATGYEPFADGWLGPKRAWGRPADVFFMPDGAMLVSDDEAGVIYRIAYGE